MPLTRLESSGHVETLVEGLKGSQFCIVSNETMEMILRDNFRVTNEAHRINERLMDAIDKLNSFQETTALGRITLAMEKLTQQNELEAIRETQSKDVLIERLDQLIEKISLSNSSLQEDNSNIIESELRKRKETIEKLIRNKEMSKYYEDLLDEPEPFVRREFRTRVNRTTTERELVHRRQQAIERVRTEIKIMQDRVLEYTEKKNAIDGRITEFLTNHEENRTEVEQQMTHQDRSTKEIFERNTMTKLKKTDDEEKMNTYEYLITVAENEALNYRGQSSRSRRRAGRRGPRQQGF